MALKQSFDWHEIGSHHTHRIVESLFFKLSLISQDFTMGCTTRWMAAFRKRDRLKVIYGDASYNIQGNTETGRKVV